MLNACSGIHQDLLTLSSLSMNSSLIFNNNKTKNTTQNCNKAFYSSIIQSLYNYV